MKILYLTSCLSILALLGCGGHGGTAPTSSSTPVVGSASKFVGSWSGPFGFTGQASNGTMAVVAASTGAQSVSLAGTFTSTSGNGTVSGYIDVNDSGSNLAYVDFTFTPFVFGGNESMDHEETAKIDASGHLILTHVTGITAGLYLAPDDFDLAPVAATAQRR